MATTKLTDSKGYDTKMRIHSATSTTDVSLAREFQNHLSDEAHKHGVIYQSK